MQTASEHVTTSQGGAQSIGNTPANASTTTAGGSATHACPSNSHQGDGTSEESKNNSNSNNNNNHSTDAISPTSSRNSRGSKSRSSSGTSGGSSQTPEWPSSGAGVSRSGRRRRRRVMYFIDDSVTNITLAEGHLMRPTRVRVLHSLVASLGLDRELTICRARPASAGDLSVFHRLAYVDCLAQARGICGDPLSPAALSRQKEFDLSAGTHHGDCPLFPEVWPLVASQAGASIACADALASGAADVAINWAGGMHHAAAAYASGFCFVNDIVLCIRRLLQRFQRVLYLDLDVHHGDGVERAFYGCSRVMTVSLHQFGDGFFPGTGDYGGAATARSFSLNAPLPARTGDEAYLMTFRTLLAAAAECHAPEAVVVQCGADTIAGDLIGRLCVTTFAHTQCVADALALGLPTVLLGGGGYHVFHAARCWALHTATALGRGGGGGGGPPLPLYIPRHDAYYAQHRRACAPLRPTLHVHLDPDADTLHAPLPLAESLSHWRRLCASIAGQLAAARAVRQSFTRTVTAACEASLQRRRRAATTTSGGDLLQQQEGVAAEASPLLQQDRRRRRRSRESEEREDSATQTREKRVKAESAANVTK